MFEVVIWALVLIVIIAGGALFMKLSYGNNAPSQTNASMGAGLIWLVGCGTFAVALVIRLIAAVVF